MIIKCKVGREDKFKKYLVLGFGYANYSKISSFRILDDDGVTKCAIISDCKANGIAFDNMIYTKMEDNSYYIYEPEIYELFVEYQKPNSSLWEEYFNDNEEVVKKVNEAIIKIAERNHFTITKPSPYGLYKNIKLEMK